MGTGLAYGMRKCTDGKEPGIAVYSQGFVLIITIMYIQVLKSVANHINEIYYLLPALLLHFNQQQHQFEHENVQSSVKLDLLYPQE